MAHVSQKKKEIVKHVVEQLKESPIIGIVNMQSLPAQQLQAMREKLRKDVYLFMTKKRLMKIAFEQLEAEKPGISKLAEYFRGMPALLFTKENPFKLFKILKKNKSPAPAKPGQIAPNDIVVNAGPTNFAPGPIIGELGKFGIKTGVENGKLAIKNDTTVCKEGEVISDGLASILTRLGIQPMEVGLDLVAIYEKGVIFTKKVLDVDEEQFISDLQKLARDAFALSVEIGFTTKDNVEYLISKAHKEAFSLGLEAVIPTADNIDQLLIKATQQGNALKSKIEG
jgi:large subunit ribosomal protein L10